MSHVRSKSPHHRAWWLAGLLSHAALHSPAMAALGDATAAGLAHPPLLAKIAPEGLTPTPYLVSEKLDGVRALWDGRTLRFRSGRTVPAPAWFLALLPAGVPLDGELWLGRGQFDALSAIVRKAEPQDADWQTLRYMVFDLPGADDPFAARSEQLKALLQQAAHGRLVWVEQRRVADAQALQRWLNEVVAQGGEGLMLHRADAPALSGRSDALLKLKPVHDAEAHVIGLRPGKGKYRGQTGALLMRTPEGIPFALGAGLSDALRRAPPAIGSTVRYRYRDLTPNGKPRFASFLRVHDDF
jgi:DNA ligase-1